MADSTDLDHAGFLGSDPVENNLPAAAARVDYRLTYDTTGTARECHGHGISGPMIPNAYFDRPDWAPKNIRTDADPMPALEFGSGDWEDPAHPANDAPEDDHISRWFQTAVREAMHEAMEWFWVDGSPYLNPHGEYETEIHDLSEEFTSRLLALRSGSDLARED